MLLGVPQFLLQDRQSFSIRKILEEAVMAQIEGDIIPGLRYWNDRPPDGVSNTGFIHDVRVSGRKVDNDDGTANDQVEYVLGDDAVLPDIIGAQAAQPG